MTEEEVHKLQNNNAVLEKEVMLIDRKLDWLLKHKAAVRAAIVARRAKFSQIWSLPPETISEIFIWLMQLDLDSFSQGAAQVKLLLVCKNWCDIALALPVLWSWISFSIRRIHNAKDFSRLGMWLARSHPGPLEFLLSLRYMAHIASKEEAQSLDMILDTVIPHIRRCNLINLYLPQKKIRRLLFSQDDMFPRLRHLRLYAMQHSSKETLHIDFSSYPQLEILHVDGSFWDVTLWGSESAA